MTLGGGISNIGGWVFDPWNWGRGIIDQSFSVRATQGTTPKAPEPPRMGPRHVH